MVNKKTVTLEGKSFYLNKWNTLVNTIDLHKSRFEGWISIKGLPFDRWNRDDVDKIGSLCGGFTRSRPNNGFSYRSKNQSPKS